MSLNGRQHLRKVGRERDAGQAHSRFRLAQAEADIVEAKERRAAADKAKGKAAARQALLEELEPILDLKLLQGPISGRQTVQQIRRQIAWHQRIGGDIHIPTGIHKMKKARLQAIMVRSVRRHLRGTSADEGNYSPRSMNNTAE